MSIILCQKLDDVIHRVFYFVVFFFYLKLGGIGYFFTKSATKQGTDSSNLDYCKYYECCDNFNIMYNIDGLKEDLKRNLFGQHIVNETLIPALKSHRKNLFHSQKPLVMSFHGTPGTGKNYVADRIVKYLYRRGDNSKFVHKFRGRVDFPLASEVNTYRVSQESTLKTRFESYNMLLTQVLWKL